MSDERLKRKGEIFLVPFDQIFIDDEINNGRIDLGNIDELASSIKEVGLKIPILVQKTRGENKYILIQGKRRFKAIEKLVAEGIDFAGVPCIMTPPNYNIENSLFDQITMNDGKPYSNLEQGIVFSQLIGRGYTVTDISKKVGKSITHINNCVEMSSLPKKVQNLISNGSVSGLTAVELSKAVPNEDELIAKLEAAVEASPQSPDGKQKKVTKKNITQIANTSPLKKMEEVKLKLNEENSYDKHIVGFFVKFYSRLKAGEPTESLMELFNS